MTIDEILNERKKAIYKCDILGVPYKGSKYVKQVLTDLIDYLPDTMGTLVDMGYDEGAALESTIGVPYTMNKIMSNANYDKKKAVIKKLDIENLLIANIVRMSLSIIDMNRPTAKDRVTDIIIHLHIFHREYVQVKELSALEINITYCTYYNEFTEKAELGTLTRWVFGNKAVEEVLNRQHKLYESMIQDWLLYSTKSGYTNYDEENNILTYKGVKTVDL